ncbi:hypothetical protein EPT61_02455 [Pediococcus pentosaceus]|uniref:hypothetical protein n=1 Tax=Pediococcus pentosaceus TaxID=1255 RepID=UPI0010093637|nr:hypothetical protein [Pediococcus pentosaceus]RXI22555.1 hypothetical protein EPT61_02455 [Pediococcus pentosaceus]
MNKYKSIEQLNKNFINAFSSPTTVQALKAASTISNSYSNTGVSESLKRVMALTSKSNVYQNNFSDITSALTSYTAFTKQYSAITNIASSAQAIIKSTEALRKSPIFYNQSEISKMIANATRTNMQSAIAWDRLSKIINDSFVDSENMTQISQNPSVKMEEMDKQSHQGTSDLENSEAVFEDIEWSPTETSGDNNVNSKDFNHENIDPEKYFSDLAQQLSDNGYGLPSVAQMLLFTAISINNFLKTIKDETELYFFWGNVIWWIYCGITHIH